LNLRLYGGCCFERLHGRLHMKKGDHQKCVVRYREGEKNHQHHRRHYLLRE